MKQQSPRQQVHSAVDEGWVHGGSFVSSILAGAALGYLLDLWLGTDPWLVVIGIVAGSYSGFMRMWHYSKRLEEQTRDR
ncbi:MAG: AtpZ/AtpI family protein [Acidimicrobiia bacterium]